MSCAPAPSRDYLLALLARLPAGPVHVLTRAECGGQDAWSGLPPQASDDDYMRGYAVYAERRQIRIDIDRRRATEEIRRDSDPIRWEHNTPRTFGGSRRLVGQ